MVAIFCVSLINSSPSSGFRTAIIFGYTSHNTDRTPRLISVSLFPFSYLFAYLLIYLSSSPSLSPVSPAPILSCFFRAAREIMI